MRRVGVLAVLVSTLAVAGLVACASNPLSPSGTVRGARPIVVFAAASLQRPFTEISEQFHRNNPGVDVDFDFAGSSELATRLTQGASADIFASADVAQMDAVARAGLLAGNPTNFAANTLVIVTGAGNPKKIRSFPDLTRPGVDVVVCQQPVPCGSATRRLEDTTGIHLDPVSEELSVTDVLNKVTTGQADAGIVYITDALSAGNTVATVTFPASEGVVNVYPIAVLKEASEPTLAQKFVAAVTAESGQQILDQSGFARP
ncbi:molybdate ABC transporter substrate-binding protein [Mycobacterium spongiae]|uniref:Molybdate ABC transporter substrate-binding protein n=1 Tax=Mycobacterium spongiae TaxID=886343 RepID=A0A975JXQ5_9MYCO|nr:molybdate ABC transporter substrate-binding protein [Mycobacterium spongiae]QUR67612.1 molybdate ABC transporter substrate-binding protein [Mycobacterium spongiae]